MSDKVRQVIIACFGDVDFVANPLRGVLASVMSVLIIRRTGKFAGRWNVIRLSPP
jgi:hypothetical protein